MAESLESRQDRVNLGWNPSGSGRPAFGLCWAPLLACDFGQVAETSCLTFPCIWVNPHGPYFVGYCQKLHTPAPYCPVCCLLTRTPPRAQRLELQASAEMIFRTPAGCAWLWLLVPSRPLSPLKFAWRGLSGPQVPSPSQGASVLLSCTETASAMAPGTPGERGRQLLMRCASRNRY